MEKNMSVKKSLPIIVCLVAFTVELLPVGAFSALVRSAATIGCLFLLCAEKLRTKNILLSIAVIAVGIPLFGAFVGFIMEGGVLMPAFLGFVAYFVVFLIIFCVIKRESLESVGWVAVVLPLAFAVAYGVLSVLPVILNDFGNMGVIKEFDYIYLTEKLAIPKSVLFYGALVILSVRCGTLSNRKENYEKTLTSNREI